MKILMINTGVFPVPSRGGVENHVYYLSKSLSEQGIEIDLVSDIGEDAEFGNINIYPVNLSELSLFDKGFKGYILRHAVGGIYAFKKARELLKSNHYDIIHVHGRAAPFLISLFEKNIPIVFTLHDDPPVKEQSDYTIYKISYKLLQEFAAKRSSHIIITSDNQKVYLKNKGVREEKITKISNGVNMDIFKMNTNITDDFCIFVGSITPRKGIIYLLEAIKRSENMKCKIIGDGIEKKAFN